MNFKVENINILKRLEKIIYKNPELTFHQILDSSGCSPVEYIKDLGNPILGKYGVLDRRKEGSVETLSRINKKTRIKIDNN